MATADTGASSVKGATERHTTAVTPEAAISAGARNQNPSKSPTEPVAAKANHIVSSSKIQLALKQGDWPCQQIRRQQTRGSVLAAAAGAVGLLSVNLARAAGTRPTQPSNQGDCRWVTKSDAIRPFTLVKAAEAAQRVGGTHFMVLPGHNGSAQGGHAYIKVFTFGAGERAPSTAMPVEEALHFLRKPQGQVAS